MGFNGLLATFETGAASGCFFVFAGILGGLGAFAGWGGVDVVAAGLAAHQSEGRERFLLRISGSGAYNSLAFVSVAGERDRTIVVIVVLFGCGIGRDFRLESRTD